MLCNESVLYSFFMAELYPIVWIYHILASLVAQMVKTAMQRDTDLIPGLGRSPWRRECLPTPVFLPGESHGQRGLEGYSPWGRKRIRHS